MRREVAVLTSQPPLGHSALTKEVQKNKDEIILCYCTIVLYCSSAIVGPCHGIFQQLSSTQDLKIFLCIKK